MEKIEEQNTEKIIISKILEFLKGIGTIILFFLFTVIGGLLLGKFYDNPNIIIATLSQLGTYSIILLGLGLIYHKQLINDFKNFKKDNVNIAFKNWIMGLIIMAISNIIISLLVKNIAPNEAANRELLKNYPISNIIIMIFMGPLIEEITFRASFKKAFSKWYIYALVTAILFGSAHLATGFTNPLELLYIIPYSSLGFFFAKAYYETDNIYTSYLAHMFHNALCILVIILF